MRSSAASDVYKRQYQSYAQLLPHYAYGRDERPSAEALATFFEKAGALHQRDYNYFLRVASYDYYSRRKKGLPRDYPQVLVALLAHFNHGDEQFKVSFDESQEVFMVDTRNRFMHRSRASLDKEYISVLDFLETKRLRLKLYGRPFDLRHLRKVKCKELEFVSGSYFIVEELVELPHLERLILHPSAVVSTRFLESLPSGVEVVYVNR